MAGKKPKLTAKRKRFVLEYLKDMNGAAAATRAGFSARTARETAYKLLKQPAVQAELALRMTAVAKRLEMNIDDVVREYVKIARANITDFLTVDKDIVTLRSFANVDPDQLAAVAEIKLVAAGEGQRAISLKLHSKTEALNALGKHFGMFVDRHDVRVEGKAEVRFYLPDNGRRPITD